MSDNQDWLSLNFSRYYQTLIVNGASQPPENALGLVAGTGITLTPSDDPVNGISGVTISATGGGGGGINLEVEGSSYGGVWTTLDLYGIGVQNEGGGTAKLIGGASWTQDCSAGGTITYGGPKVVPSVVILTGAPAAAFTFLLPAYPAQTLVVNQTGKLVTVGTVANPIGVTIGYQTALNMAQVHCDGTYVQPAWIAPGIGDVDGSNNTPYGAISVVIGIGSSNYYQPGDLQSVQIVGPVLQVLDSYEYGVNIPAYGTGPGDSTPSTCVFYTVTTTPILAGWQSQDNSGWADVLAPVATQGVVAWAGPDGPVLTGGKQVFYDTIVGSVTVGGTTSFTTYAPVNSSGNGSMTCKVKTSCRVLSTSGTSETVGDSFMEIDVVGMDGLGGSGALMSPIGATVGLYPQQWARPDTLSISGTTVTISQGLGAELEITVSNATTVDPSTVVLVQVHIYESDTV